MADRPDHDPEPDPDDLLDRLTTTHDILRAACAELVDVDAAMAKLLAIAESYEDDPAPVVCPVHGYRLQISTRPMSLVDGPVRWCWKCEPFARWEAELTEGDPR